MANNKLFVFGRVTGWRGDGSWQWWDVGSDGFKRIQTDCMERFLEKFKFETNQRAQLGAQSKPFTLSEKSECHSSMNSPTPCVAVASISISVSVHFTLLSKASKDIRCEWVYSHSNFYLFISSLRLPLQDCFSLHMSYGQISDVFLFLLGSIIDFVLRPAIGHLPRSIGLCDSVRIFGLVPQYVFSTLSSVFSLQWHQLQFNHFRLQEPMINQSSSWLLIALQSNFNLYHESTTVTQCSCVCSNFRLGRRPYSFFWSFWPLTLGIGIGHGISWVWSRSVPVPSSNPSRPAFKGSWFQATASIHTSTGWSTYNHVVNPRSWGTQKLSDEWTGWCRRCCIFLFVSKFELENWKQVRLVGTWNGSEVEWCWPMLAPLFTIQRISQWCCIVKT